MTMRNLTYQLALANAVVAEDLGTVFLPAPHQVIQILSLLALVTIIEAEVVRPLPVLPCWSVPPLRIWGVGELQVEPIEALVSEQSFEKGDPWEGTPPFNFWWESPLDLHCRRTGAEFPLLRTYQLNCLICSLPSGIQEPKLRQEKDCIIMNRDPQFLKPNLKIQLGVSGRLVREGEALCLRSYLN